MGFEGADCSLVLLFVGSDDLLFDIEGVAQEGLGEGQLFGLFELEAQGVVLGEKRDDLFLLEVEELLLLS